MKLYSWIPVLHVVVIQESLDHVEGLCERGSVRVGGGCVLDQVLDNSRCLDCTLEQDACYRPVD